MPLWTHPSSQEVDSLLEVVYSSQEIRAFFEKDQWREDNAGIIGCCNHPDTRAQGDVFDKKIAEQTRAVIEQAMRKSI